MTLFVLVLICGASQPNCTPQNARDYQAFRAPPGIVICGVPVTMQIAMSPAGPDETEYLRVRCELRRD